MNNNSSSFPKVLILGQTFNLSSGSGITKTNLFLGWPKDRIAVATYESGLLENQICDNFYLLGNKESKYWKIYKIKEKSRAVILNMDELKPAQKTPEKPTFASPLKGLIHKLRNFFVGFFGLHYQAKKWVVSDDLLRWIDDLAPDCIYTNLHDYAFTKFTESILAKRNIPLVIHIMDDWMPSIEPKGLLHQYWIKQTDQLFRKMLDKAVLNMSICQYMSDVYFQRYQKTFIPFHNCIDLDDWQSVIKTTKNHPDPFIVLYAGRIGPGTSNSVLDIAQAIDQLVTEGLKITFEVQSNTITPDFQNQLRLFANTTINDFLPYSELPRKFAAVNLLVLPIDNDKENLSYIHLSMPTKVPEYMACGTPILVYAPQKTALYDYANTSKWALTVINNGNKKLLKSALREVCTNESIQKSISNQAIHIVKQNHNRGLVKRNFQNTLAEYIKANVEKN